MSTETDFHRFADATLAALFEQLESAYESGSLEDLDLQDGILTIQTQSAQTFVVSKHTASGQIWLASPLTGGLHFSFQDGEWKLADGTILAERLTLELMQVGGL
ncbi:MAG: iron donor protein CyaY [Alphaproteobacteria bacterium]|nr:iron donor protein CyaY [Alphaproteobacteria bacterium]